MVIIICGTDIEAIGTGIGDSGEQEKVSTLIFLKYFVNVKLYIYKCFDCTLDMLVQGCEVFWKY